MAVVCFWSWYLTERLENWVINSSSQKRTQKALPELQPRRQDDLDVFWLIHAGICVRSIQVQLTRLKIERKLFFPFLFRIHSRQNTTTVCQLLSRCLNSLSFLCSFEWRWMKVHCEEQYPRHPCTLSNDINVTDINESQVWKCVSYRKTIWSTVITEVFSSFELASIQKQHGLVQSQHLSLTLFQRQNTAVFRKASTINSMLPTQRNNTKRKELVKAKPEL